MVGRLIYLQNHFPLSVEGNVGFICGIILNYAQASAPAVGRVSFYHAGLEVDVDVGRLGVDVNPAAVAAGIRVGLVGLLDFAGIVGDLGRAADSQRASAYEYAAAVAAGRKVIVDNAALQVDGPILYVNGAAPSGLAILDCAAFDIHRAILQIHGAAVLLRPLCHSATPTLHTAPLRRAARKAPPKTG